jgi:predicted nucleic acid-binding protein
MAWLLDSNVLSELRKKVPDPKVLRWVEEHEADFLYISVISLGEIREGIEAKRLKDPEQAKAIEKWFIKVMDNYKPRILDVTKEIADRWGRLCPGQPLSDADGLIAATALERGLTVVTRNVRDYRRTGVKLLNPFE